MASTKRVAVLIDVENVSTEIMPDVMKCLKQYKSPYLIRAYADWSKHNLNNWLETVTHYGINSIHQPSYVSGKNSSDIALVIDAMDLVYTRQFDIFVLVTSDSDFIRLAIRLKELGAYVIGVAEKNIAPAFKHACNQFVISQQLSAEVVRILDIWPNEVVDWLSIGQFGKYWIAAGYPSQKGKYVKMFEKYPQNFLLKRNNQGVVMVKRKINEL